MKQNQTVIFSDQMKQPYGEFFTSVLKYISEHNQNSFIILSSNDNEPEIMDLFIYNAGESALNKGELALRRCATNMYATAVVEELLRKEQEEGEEETEDMLTIEECTEDFEDDEDNIEYL